MRRCLLVLSAIASLAAAAPAALAAKPKPARPTVTLKLAKSKAPATAGIAVKLTVEAKASKGRKLTKLTLPFGDGSKPVTGKKPRAASRHALQGGDVHREAHGHRQPQEVRHRQAQGQGRRQTREHPAPLAPVPQSASSTPLPPLDLDAAALTVAVGSQELVALPDPLISVTRVDAVQGLPAGVTAAAQAGGLRIVADMQADPAARGTVTFIGRGCAATDCDRSLTLRVQVAVRGMRAPVDSGEFTERRADRVAKAAAIPDTDDGKTLQDELLIALGTPDDPGDRTLADGSLTKSARSFPGP